MKPVDMTKFGDGRGNCFAACLASLLEIPITDVFEMPDGSALDWRQHTNNWLSDKGFWYLDMTLHEDLERIGDARMHYWGWHIIIGKATGGGDDRHSVIGYRGKLWFDPNPNRRGLLGTCRDWSYGFLVPKDVLTAGKPPTPWNCRNCDDVYAQDCSYKFSCGNFA
jgi:hypothetical protein